MQGTAHYLFSLGEGEEFILGQPGTKICFPFIIIEK